MIHSTDGELDFLSENTLSFIKTGSKKKNHKRGENTGKVADSVARNKHSSYLMFSLRGRKQDHLPRVRESVRDRGLKGSN